MTPALTEAQLARLYDDFRGASYDAQRMALEPAYELRRSGLVDRCSAYHDRRRAFYDTFPGERFKMRGLVVDVSDGDGYFARYAYPHADVVTFPRLGAPAGVDVDDLLGSADILMMTHRLQSEPRPHNVLFKLTRKLKPHARLWIDVPVQYAGSLEASFALREARERQGIDESDPLQTLDETLSHFSVASLSRLLQEVGFQPLEFAHPSSGLLGVFAASIHPSDGDAQVDEAGQDTELAPVHRSTSSRSTSWMRKLLRRIPPGAGAALAPSPALQLGVRLPFGDPFVEPYLVRGFSFAEEWGRWTDGPIAVFRCRHPTRNAAGLFEVWPQMVWKGRSGRTGRLEVAVNDGRRQRVLVEAGRSFGVAVAPRDMASPELEIAFYMQASKMADEEPAFERRALGLGIAAVRLSVADAGKTEPVP